MNDNPDAGLLQTWEFHLEEWRPVIGFEGYYEVSSHGQVRSVDRIIHTKTGPQKHRGQLLTNSVSGNGYYLVTLSPPRGKHYVHVLVAKSFHGDLSETLLVLHKDDNRMNNLESNLRWGTQAENMSDAVRNGRLPQALKTHCVRDHPLSGDNVRVRVRNGKYHRVCRACKKLRG